MITRALVLAHLSHAGVKLDLVSDSVVKRVNPFLIGRGGPRPTEGSERLPAKPTQRTRKGLLCLV